MNAWTGNHTIAENGNFYSLLLISIIFYCIALPYKFQIFVLLIGIGINCFILQTKIQKNVWKIRKISMEPLNFYYFVNFL